jgi:ribosomal protein S18 acetylase RimI-like enzyme
VATLNEGLHFRGGDRVGPDEYRALLAAIGWRPPDQDAAALDSALRRSWNVTVRTTAGDLVGLARVLDDGVMYASVWDLIVAPERQRRGIGRQLLAAVMARTAERRLVSLIATAAGEALYRAAGFAETDGRSTAMFIRHTLPTAAMGDGETDHAGRS